MRKGGHLGHKALQRASKDQVVRHGESLHNGADDARAKMQLVRRKLDVVVDQALKDWKVHLHGLFRTVFKQVGEQLVAVGPF